jgi:U3 small nucleolar RNA-associated protein 4
MVSWWNREVRIWRVKSRAEGAEKPKVVARIAIQGQDNITSVSISRDGSLLAVATGSEVKSFHLAPSDPAVGPAFRIRKLEMPWINGAKLVRIANNGMWVAIVTVTNEIQLVRIIKSEDPSERPRILQSLIPIYRLQREESLRDPLHGHWGHYNRSITHAEFSTDSNMFAVTDLAGYLDTWVVAGNEDVTAPEFDVGSTAHSSSSEEEEESDDDDEDPLRKKVVTILGQRWIRNPSGHLLPRLDATPLLLSFQPETEGPSRPSPNGNPAVHATRNNPHPHSHDIPEVEQKLLVVTAKLELCLFEVLAGRLSEWSRKNPPSLFPQQFRRLDDPAKGCIWDVAGKNNRLWLYGEKWLFMFDLSTDFPIADSIEEANGAEGTSASRKRKRAAGKEGGRKINSGAGGAISQTEAPVAKLRKFTSGKAEGQGKSTWIDLGGTRHGPGSDDDDDYDGMEARHQSLASLRQSATNDDMADASADSVVPLDEKDGSSGEGRRRKQESWWHSFKYRPILGIVPMRGEGEALEVVLVERPSWDLDLPPRFVGSHE